MPSTIRPKLPSSISPSDGTAIKRALPRKMRSLPLFMPLILGLMANVKLLWAMIRDKDFKLDWPTRAKILACLAYFIAPVDIIPDFIPIVGYIDDAIVLGLGMKLLSDVIDRYESFRSARKQTLPAPSQAQTNPI